jgi:hypothetical protein
MFRGVFTLTTVTLFTFPLAKYSVFAAGRCVSVAECVLANKPCKGNAAIIINKKYRLTGYISLKLRKIPLAKAICGSRFSTG